MKRKINKKISDPEKSRLFRVKFSVPEKIRQKNFSVPFSGGQKSGRRDNMSFRRPFSDNSCIVDITQNTAVAFCAAILDVLKPLA